MVYENLQQPIPGVAVLRHIEQIATLSIYRVGKRIVRYRIDPRVFSRCNLAAGNKIFAKTPRGRQSKCSGNFLIRISATRRRSLAFYAGMFRPRPSCFTLYRFKLFSGRRYCIRWFLSRKDFYLAALHETTIHIWEIEICFIHK